jgi:photosystem II stability/assembly factor-like uncharacterized protein
MKKRAFAAVAVILISTTALLVLLCLMGRTSPSVSGPALAAPMQITPTVTVVDPSSAPNDLDTLISITGTDFVSVPAVYLGDTSLSDVEWMTSTVLRATVPWGMDPGVYTLTVSNAGGESGDLPNAFTVTQGIGVWTAGKLYGGPIGAIDVNPLTPTILYAISPDVGLFRSRDGGESWSFQLATVDAGAPVIDRSSPNRVYIVALGLLHRSDDGGDAWDSFEPPYDRAARSTVYVHPDNGTVYLGAHGDTIEQSGLYASTDGGQTWMTMTNGLTDTHVLALAFHPTDPMTMVVGTWHGNVFVSSNGGVTWTFASKPVERVQRLAFNPFGEHELWVSDCCFCVPQYTYRSTNLTYTEWITTLASPLMSIAFPDPDGWGDTYSRTVYAAGCWRDAYKTTDSGDTWESWGPETWGHQVALDPATPDHIYLASFQHGIYETIDGGDIWQVTNQGLTAMAPYELATVPGTPDIIYAVVQYWGGVFRGTRGGESWQFFEVGDADASKEVYVLIDPHEPERIYVSGRQKVFRSDDAGLTWPISVTFEPPDICSVSVQAFDASVLRADPVYTDTLLAGMGGVCNYFEIFLGDIQRSTDGGLTWTTTLTPGQLISEVVDIAYDALTETIVYAATWGSGMLRSTDGGQSWQPMGKGIAALNRVGSIAVEPSDPYRVFAWSEAGLYVSENHGKSWAQADFPLAGFQVEQILCTHDDPSSLYLAVTDGWLGPGLFRSTDGAQSWEGLERAAGTLGYVPIYSLATVTATDRVILYAGTTGGYVESGGAQALEVANNSGILVNAGVYRYTTQRTWELYLPLVFKAYTP